MEKPLLEVDKLKTYFYTEDGVVPAVDNISFLLNERETIGIVGESGCGKSVMSLSVMRLLQTPPAKIVGGRILFDGKDLLKVNETEMRDIRGSKISMIFQEPMTSLNPVLPIGYQIAESVKLHQGKSRAEANRIALDMLGMVGIPSPVKRMTDYPHQLSGGMRQRVMIAIALVCNPRLLIADEPTTALDVTIQAQILDLMVDLKEKLGMSMMFITHDLGVVSEIADKIAVFYAGKIVEKGSVKEVFTDPRHPYTLGLLKSVPRLQEDMGRLNTISGMVPNSLNMPRGCRFHPRCEFAKDICTEQEPALLSEDGHVTACWRYK